MKLYVITSEKQQKTLQTFEAACKERKVELVSISVNDLNYLELPELETGDMMYRIAINPGAKFVEDKLYHDGVATMHRGASERKKDRSQELARETAGIPVPKTIKHSTKDRELLAQYAEHLGFPLVLKLGGSHGVGVIKVDSLDSLVSAADYLLSTDTQFTMQQFIPVTRSARLIVLGDQVIDSIEYQAASGDFRTNAGDKFTVVPKKFSEEVEQSAVATTHLSGFDFGGVDILIDEDNNHYVLEVNSPCFFYRCQSTTGTDIAGMMVDHLMKKAESLTD